MQQDFIVYPTKGFLNTEFNIKSNKSSNYYIYYDEELFATLYVSEGETKKLKKFVAPGQYIISASEDNTSSEIKVNVEDAIRVGSSTLKKAYTFDIFPYLVFVMQDRLHIYDPSSSNFLYTENLLSPDSIYCMNNKKLLFVTKHEVGTSISLFSIDNYSIIGSIECGELVAKSLDNSRLYLKNRNSNEIYCVLGDSLQPYDTWKLCNNENINEKYWIDKEKNLLFILTDYKAYCINVNNGKIKYYDTNDAIGITSNGYLVKNCYGNRYDYINMNPEEKQEGSFFYKSLHNRLSFKGHSFCNSKWETQIFHDFKAYLDACEDKIIEAFKSEINDDVKVISKECKGSISSAEIDIYPSENGVYIVEDSTIQVFKNLSYNVVENQLKYNPVTSTFINLIWIANDDFLIRKCYNNNYAIKIVDNKAAIAISSSQSVLLENGHVIEKFNDLSGAKNSINPNGDPKEDDIIIDDKRISNYYIKSRAQKKLIIYQDEKYKYYELKENLFNNKFEWTLSDIVNLEIDMHSRAILSDDGKYLVYSKGRNQYAIYDIENRIEKDVYTGNLVDLDDSGNIILSYGYRQLRIYDPKSFKGVGYCPEYYRFTSHDGKLYAKTSIKTRYYNLINNKEISKDEYDKYKKELDWKDFGNTEEDKKKCKEARKRFIEQNILFFENKVKDLDEKKKKTKFEQWLNSWFFSDIFLTTKQFVVIGIVATKEEIEIELDTKLDFLNYISFSYDNEYVAIVGKPSSNGYLKLIKIQCDIFNNKIKVIDNICDMQIARKATWTCAFTQNGLFGTYDSLPTLYLLDKMDISSFDKNKSHDYNYLKNHFSIPNRSLMCFSKSGKYMALSIQGYDPISLGGIGHLPSNKMFIYTAEKDPKLLDEWEYQGQKVSKLSPSDPYKKNLVQAGFSDDDSKLMTVTEDGVIIVRNLHLE